MRNMLFLFLIVIALPSFAQPHKTKNIIVLSIDGYRWKDLFEGADSSLVFSKHYVNQDSAWVMKKYWAATAAERREKLMPFVWQQLVKKGQLYGNRELGSNVNVRNKYWFSYPGRSETFCGYYDSAVNSNEYPDNPNENVLEFVNKQPGYKNKVVTFASWDAVARIINRNRNGMLVNIYDEDVKGPGLTAQQKEMNKMQHYFPDIFGQGERADAMTYAMTKAFVVANHPRMLYIDFGDTDEFAHAGKYDLYLDAVNKTDMMIADLWNYLQQDPFYKDQTTIMICADHGRGYGNEWTSHGSRIPHADETYLMVMGPDSPALGEVKGGSQIYQDQFAQTMAHLLGLNFTANHPVGNPVGSVIK